MIIQVVNPSVCMLTSRFDARKALALCAYHAGISRGRIADQYSIKRFDSVGKELSVELVGSSTADVAKSFEDAEALISKLVNMKPRAHESVLEHGTVSFLFTGSRIFTHEMVRHKIGLALTQMSTRFIEEGDTVMLIRPPHMPVNDVDTYEFEYIGWHYRPVDDQTPQWVRSAAEALAYYRGAREEGLSRESARYVIPHCIAASIGITGNFRAWCHIIRDRTVKAAAPEIKGLIFQVKEYLAQVSPVLVEGL